MARNRLYIRDAATGHLFYLAKSTGRLDSDVVGPTGFPTTMALVTDADDEAPFGLVDE